jgi:hypothetical protein
VTAEYPPKCVENGVELQWSVNDREGTSPQRGHQLADILSIARLSRPHDNGRGGLIEATEQLQNAGAAGNWPRSAAGERDFQIHHRDMDRLVLDQRSGFLAGIGLQCVDSHRLQQPGQLPNGGVLSPAAIGQQ